MVFITISIQIYLTVNLRLGSSVKMSVVTIEAIKVLLLHYETIQMPKLCINLIYDIKNVRSIRNEVTTYNGCECLIIIILFLHTKLLNRLENQKVSFRIKLLQDMFRS